MAAQLVDQVRCEIEPGREVVVVVGRDRQGLDPAPRERARAREDVVRTERDVVHAGAREGRDRARGRGVGALRDVERQAQRAVGARDRAAAHHAVGVIELERRLRCQTQHRAVEQDPALELAVRQRLRDVVDRDQARVRLCRFRLVRFGCGDEVSIERAFAQFRLGNEIEQAAVERADCRDLPFLGADAAGEARAGEGLGARQRLRRVGRRQAQRADRGPMHQQVGMRERVRLGVEHEVDRTLAEQTDLLAAMAAGAAEAEPAEHGGERCLRRVVDRDLDEGDAVEARHWRRIEQLDTRAARARRRRLAQERARLLLEEQQRAHAVHRGRPRGSGAEVVVEHFQRDRPGIARAQDRREEGRDVEIALAGEAAEMPAPRQQVHGEPRRIRDLDEGDALARHVGDRRRVAAERQRMEAVEHQAEMRVRRLRDQPPGMLPRADPGAPGERLVADAQAPACRALGERVELGGGARVVVDRLRPHVRAHQHQRRVEVAHHVELALGALEVARELFVADALEVAERLVERDLEPEIGGEAAHVARAAVEEQQVVLEDLDRVEARRRGRPQLLLERAAERDRRNRTSHGNL